MPNANNAINAIPTLAKSYVHSQHIANISSSIILILVIIAAITFIGLYIYVRNNKQISNKKKNCTRYGIVVSIALLIILLAIPQPATHNTHGNINIASTINHDITVLPKEAKSYRALVPTLKKAQKAKQHTPAQTAAMAKASRLMINARKQEFFIQANAQYLQNHKPVWYSYL